MEETKRTVLPMAAFFIGEFITTLKVLGVYTICSLPMLIAMAYTTLNTQPERTLDDLMFKVIPFVPYYTLPEWILAVIIVATALPILIFTPTHILYGLRSTLLFFCPLYLIRSLTISSTLMPDPFGLCLATSPMSKDILNSSLLEIIGAHFSGKLRLCADLIFSGHTLTAGYMIYLIDHLYKLPRLSAYRKRALRVAGVTYVVLIYAMLACRFHYTVDILISLVLLVLGILAHDSITKVLIRHNNWYINLLYGKTLDQFGVAVTDSILILAPGVMPEDEVIVTEARSVLYKGKNKIE